MLGPSQLVDAQQVNVIINHQWPILYAEVQQMPMSYSAVHFRPSREKVSRRHGSGSNPFACPSARIRLSSAQTPRLRRQKRSTKDYA
ncbi:MAG TPA: hypothetical protein P5169_00005, partial [Kiritimatiellia bacterium]|nr:hypothetical protein [Kiritimatiellia bacterium]